LRMLWEHRDRQRELSSPPTHLRRRKRHTSPDSPPLTPTDLPLPFPSGFPSRLRDGCIPTVPDSLSNSAGGCIPTVPPDSPSVSHPGFPSRLREGCIPTVPPPTPQTIAPQHPPNPKTAILRNEPKPATRKLSGAEAARRAATERFSNLFNQPTPPNAPKARAIHPPQGPTREKTGPRQSSLLRHHVPRNSALREVSEGGCGNSLCTQPPA
jgi:hypothetical protein